MAPSVKQIIAAINPELYCSFKGEKDEAGMQLRDFKNLVKIEGIQKAAEKARPKPLAEHTLLYDSSSETLEPIYFFMLDLMGDYGLSPEKIVDNFSSSPGSGHFAELGQRATIMQQQGTKILGDVNTVLRSILNLVYDLKDFRTRLKHYEDLKSGDSSKKEAAVLSLKQIWMDKVDIQKGNSSIKAMALGQSGFQTLIDAFLFAKDEREALKIDLNDRVKRILVPRIQEFNTWLGESEKELRKRYNLEKTYLKSQVNSLKLYIRWAKPYLKAAQQLESTESRNASLVKVFNTIILELTLLGKKKLDIAGAIEDGKLPVEFKKMKIKRDYYSCILIEFSFRGIPQRISQQAHYTFGGRAEITFSAYALNEDELNLLNKELEKSDVNDALQLIEGATTESLSHLQDEINEFLEEKTEEEKKKEEKKEDVNPFLALFGAYDKSEKPKEKSSQKKDGEIRKDDWVEKEHFRKVTKDTALFEVYDLFDIYKKAHGMPSFT
jgi:hypothetical protein